MTTDERDPAQTASASASDTDTIENLLREERTFPPSAEFVGRALLNDPEIYERTASEEGAADELRRDLRADGIGGGIPRLLGR